MFRLMTSALFVYGYPVNRATFSGLTHCLKSSTLVRLTRLSWQCRERSGQGRATGGKETGMNLTAVYVRSGNWIAAWIEEIPGVNTQGATMEEARANLREALALILEDNRADAEQALIGQPVLEREQFALLV